MSSLFSPFLRCKQDCISMVWLGFVINNPKMVTRVWSKCCFILIGAHKHVASLFSIQVLFISPHQTQIQKSFMLNCAENDVLVYYPRAENTKLRKYSLPFNLVFSQWSLVWPVDLLSLNDFVLIHFFLWHFLLLLSFLWSLYINHSLFYSPSISRPSSHAPHSTSPH